MASISETTKLLRLASEGDMRANAALFQHVYDELHRLAANRMRNERVGHTLQATALVNEAYIRLADGNISNVKCRAHFFALAARVIRQILIEHARKKGTLKRGRDINHVGLGEIIEPAESVDFQVLDYLALDETLKRLAELDERQARIVELRYFGGLSIEDTALVIETSPKTVDRHWRLARAWILREMAI